MLGTDMYWVETAGEWNKRGNKMIKRVICKGLFGSDNEWLGNWIKQDGKMLNSFPSQNIINTTITGFFQRKSWTEVWIRSSEIVRK